MSYRSEGVHERRRSRSNATDATVNAQEHFVSGQAIESPSTPTRRNLRALLGSLWEVHGVDLATRHESKLGYVFNDRQIEFGESTTEFCDAPIAHAFIGHRSAP
jgi:hypothetical protein